MRAAIRGARRAIKAVVHPSIAPFAVRAFRGRAAACADPASALELARSFDYGRIRITPVQVRSEIMEFLGVAASRAPRAVLEIGTANGGTLFLFTRVAAPDALVISLDLPSGRFGGGYPAWKAPLYRAFARGTQRIELLRGDSHAPDAVAGVTRLLGGRPLDLLFIDGDHAYDGVRSDFEMYAPFVRPGGLVAFHDIVPGPDGDVGGVPRFWRELKAGRRTNEIVADWNQGGFGIGWFEAEGSAD